MRKIIELNIFLSLKFKISLKLCKLMIKVEFIKQTILDNF